jgi:hypothetical protein
MIALARQQIVTSSGNKLEASSLTKNMAGFRVRQLVRQIYGIFMSCVHPLSIVFEPKCEI